MAHKLEDSKYVRVVRRRWLKTVRRFEGTEAHDFYRYKSELYPCKHIHWIACGTSPALVACDACRTTKKTFPDFRADCTIESRIQEVRQMIMLAEEAIAKPNWRYGHRIIPYTPRAKSIAGERLPRLRERLTILLKILNAPT